MWWTVGRKRGRVGNCVEGEIHGWVEGWDGLCWVIGRNAEIKRWFVVDGRKREEREVQKWAEG